MGKREQFPRCPKCKRRIPGNVEGKECWFCAHGIVVGPNEKAGVVDTRKGGNK